MNTWGQGTGGSFWSPLCPQTDWMEKRWEQSSHCYNTSKIPMPVGIKSDSSVPLASAEEYQFAEPMPPDSDGTGLEEMAQGRGQHPRRGCRRTARVLPASPHLPRLRATLSRGRRKGRTQVRDYWMLG